MSEMVKRCPECSSINLTVDEKRGEIICKSCGLVLDDNMIDTSPEWREFSDDGEDHRRAGAPATFTKADMGTGTQIGTTSELYALSGSQRRRFMRLKQWHNRSSTSLEKNLQSRCKKSVSQRQINGICCCWSNIYRFTEIWFTEKFK